MNTSDNHIDYIELKANNLERIKLFYNQVFDWKFTDYGPNYVSFENSGVAGGFEKTDETISNGALIVLYHKNLTLVKNKVIEAGGKITKDIFSFPGGQRFQFIDTSSNELSVWSE